MKTFSFRAECLEDVRRFQCACLSSRLVVVIPNKLVPDVDVEVRADASLESLRNAMRRVVDGHVMLQTLRECPLSENPLERNYDLR